MVRASVLERMSGPLCDAALKGSGSAARLERIAQSNLFLIPLAGETPPTYRFQRLFREALAAELQRAEPGLAETLAARASVWCEERGDIESAVEYAWAAGDQERFASLLERFVLPLYYSGRLATIERWLALVDHATARAASRAGGGRSARPRARGARGPRRAVGGGRRAGTGRDGDARRQPDLGLDGDAPGGHVPLGGRGDAPGCRALHLGARGGEPVAVGSAAPPRRRERARR